MSALRVCHIGRAQSAGSAGSASQLLERVRALGFDTVLMDLGPAEEVSPALARACESRGLSLFLDLNPFELDLNHPLVAAHPDAFAIRRAGEPGAVVDPRHPSPGKGHAYLRDATNLELVVDWWTRRTAAWLSAGVRGFRLLHPLDTPHQVRQALMGSSSRTESRRATFIADTSGADRTRLGELKGFDYTLSSLPWWDERASWLVEEYAALSQIAPVLAQVDAPGKLSPASPQQRCGRLAIAAVTGTGLFMPLSYIEMDSKGGDAPDISDSVRTANRLVAKFDRNHGQLQSATGPGAPLTILVRANGPDLRTADDGLLAMINPDPVIAVEPTPELLRGLGAFNKLEPLAGLCESGPKLKPGEVRLFRARRVPLIVSSGRADWKDAETAAASSRIAIEAVSPAVDDGAFPAKAVVGDVVDVEADIFGDGHPVLAAELQYRALGEAEWRRVRMRPLVNDRWAATMPLERIGPHEFAVEAWIDIYGTFVRDLVRKRDAGVDITLELQEGANLLKAAAKQASGACEQGLSAILRGFEALHPNDRAALLIASETVEMMRRADERRFKGGTRPYPVFADRREAQFSSWYELFPRSQSGDASRHGTFRDVVPRLAAIRDMGFDILYFPPIHPIGKTNRKGKNNSLKPNEGDPGSVYAIGSEDGGHDSVHPELGTIEDFHALVAAAREHGLELALDLAVQASPDHPWLKEHPGWFDWRPDGSIKYAENPPKKYEDIVNVDFYARDAVPGLWEALRNIVLLWIGHGVKIFRVDNPHTKPFPFWEWLIEDVHARHPDVIFLAEAFTRPKVMYRLGKIGFTQSYTYFTWRHTKQELTEYMTELSTAPVSNFYRPHFFVNTPDINPHFLQQSGRPGFLIRAALATTLSGLWGMYSGFELCESAALPGKEEYLDSEKYEIKPRDWHAPGNIVPEITQLNRLRKAEPALQSHLGLTFYNAFNDNILYFGKAVPGYADRILVAISLDPHHPQEADFEIPLWEWGRGDHESLECEDLLRGGHTIWRGKIQRMRLTPDMPYAIWRVQPAREV